MSKALKHSRNGSGHKTRLLREHSPNSERPTTILDIARIAGVSQSTVSRVLNGTTSNIPIADDTRERILIAAKKLGYRPNPLARGLRGAQTMLLGAIVRDITDPFFAVAVDVLSVEALSRGYNIVLGHAHSHAQEAVALREVLETRHCDAILLMGDMDDQPALVEDLRRSRTPTVALWNGSHDVGIRSVNVDNAAGIELVVEHLISLGHRRIGLVRGARLGDLQEREEAYRRCLATHGIDVPEGYVQIAPNQPGGGWRAMTAWAQLTDPPSAVVACTDVLAVDVVHAAQVRGLKVPGDLSVTGFDDIPLAAYLAPALTTVHMPVQEIVSDAIRIVTDKEIAPTNPDANYGILVEPTLVLRASTGRPTNGHL